MKVVEHTLKFLSILILSCTFLVLGCTQQNNEDEVELTEPKIETETSVDVSAETKIETESNVEAEPEANAIPPQPVPPTPESSMVE